MLDLIRVLWFGSFMLHARCLLQCLGFCMFMNDVQIGLHVGNGTLETLYMTELGSRCVRLR